MRIKCTCGMVVKVSQKIIAGHLRRCRPSPGRKNPYYDQEHAAGAIVRGLKRPDSLESMLAATLDLAADLRSKALS